MDKKKIGELIFKISCNDDKAFEELYCTVKSAVFSFAYSICGNWHTSEDILHDVFLRIRKYAGNYKHNTSSLAWIHTITKNVTLNKIRSASQYDIKEPEEMKNSFFEDDKSSMVENRLMLEQVFKVLNDVERQIVTLHAISDMKHSDIAAMLEKPYGTVLWTYSNAIKKLKKSISQI